MRTNSKLGVAVLAAGISVWTGVASLAAAVGLRAPSGGAGTRQEGTALADSAEVGRVLDREGVALRRAVLARRAEGIDGGAPLAVGDLVEVGARGANALALRLAAGAELTLGPGTLVELLGPERVRLLNGDLEVDARESRGVEVLGRGSNLTVGERAVVRARAGELERLEADPAWLRGYESGTSTEALGSLLANVDGRNVPLTIGYHKVTVDVRDQIARTVIEESFVNHTSSVLEGVFYFPLPADASISSFGMWIGGELVEGDIVEKQRAREIYETILREKRDPGLLEWSGGNIFKARVYPIGSEKRIRIAYTQVLGKVGDTFSYRYALQSEMLRKTPLERLEIEVNVASSQQLAAVECPSHECRIRTTEHAARVELSAAEFVPENDFELRVRTVSDEGRITVVPHRRGDDGYFMLLIDAPTAAAKAAQDRPLELLVLADTSGSMWGEPRTNQIAAVEALLAGLGEGDRFNLATCDVQTRWAFEQSVSAGDPGDPRVAAQRRAALDFLEARDPLGWSDLDAAFAAALDRAGPETHVVYIGDGVPTSGTADPVALKTALQQRYGERGQGSFHAIVPGSSSERIVLRALAGLGRGSLRSIGGGSDPAQTAFDLLDEIRAPGLSGLELELEGIAAAAVYPRDLPNLPAGAQQVVVGRFDPTGGALKGTARVRAELPPFLGGEAVSFEVPVDLTLDDDAGNSFVPRLWARHHLDHLLDQGRGREVRERIIALSEDYQIVTPYSSFLVLESDADRERFGVQKRFRMRDGEEFFAEGRDAARHALVRQQMLAARGWRRELREHVLRELADMGRGMTEWLDAGVVPYAQEPALAGLGYAGGAGAPQASRSYRGPGDTFAEGPDSLPAEDFGDELLDEPLEGDDLSLADEREESDLDGLALEEEVSLDRSNEGFFLGRGESKRQRSAAQASAYVARNRRSLTAKSIAPGPWRETWSPFDGLFPNVGGPRPAASELPFPPEVLEALRTLDHRAPLASTDGVWRIDVDTTWTDARGRASQASGRTWVAGDEWVSVAPHVAGNEFNLDWSLEGERGVLTAGWRLGRVRAATEGDGAAWAAPFDWHFDDSVRGYAGYAARLVPAEAGRVVVELRAPGADPGDALALELDTARGVVLAERWLSGGEPVRGRTFSDFHEVGGLWWPARIRSWDTRESAGSSETRIVVAQEPGAQLSTAANSDLARRADALLLPAADVPLTDAKDAVAAGNAGLGERWVLLRHFASTQRWDRARPHLEAIVELAEGRPGLAGLRLTFLQHARRQEELRLELARVAAELAATPVEAEFGVANRLLGLSGGLHQGIEVLALLDELRSVFERQTAIVDAELAWQRRFLQALANLDRPEELLRAQRDAAERWPHDIGLRTGLVQLLAQRGEVDEALAELDRADAQTFWTDWERLQLRSRRLDVLWNSYRLEALASVIADWDVDPAVSLDASIYDRYLSALVMLDREREATDLMDDWLRSGSAAAEDDTVAQARLYACVSHALGQGFNLYSNRLVPGDVARLERTVRVLLTVPQPHAATDGAVARILHHHAFRSSDAGRALVEEMFSQLAQSVDELPAVRLAVQLGWLSSARGTSEDIQAAWPTVLERVYARWLSTTEEADSERLGDVIRAHGDRGMLTRFLREQLARAEDGAERAGAARELFHALLAGEWSADVQRETVGLLAAMALDGGTEEERARDVDRRVLDLYRLVNWVLDARTRVELAAHPEFELLSRRALSAERKRVHAEVRTDLIELLSVLDDTLEPSELREWAAVERTWLEVKSRTRLDDAWGRALAMLESGVDRLVADGGGDAVPPLRVQVLTARWAQTCAYLLLSSSDAELDARIEALTAQLARLVEAESDLPDGRVALRDLWLVLDRPAELEAALAGWLGDGGEHARLRWGRDYAHVLAERGLLERAALVLEEIERIDELSAADLERLAGWYTALDDAERARDARARSYDAQGEGSLAAGLRRDAQRVQRRGEGPPEELAHDVPERLVVLFSKAQSPQQHFWVLRDLYSATKDFRLLECLPRAVLGQSAQGVYPFLGESATLAHLIGDEATVDRVLAGLEAARESAATAVDRRALHLLAFQIVPRATYQSHGVERHVERAAAALEAAFDGEWVDGEPLLMAELLAAQGALMTESLAREQMRQLRALVPLAADPDERLAISRHLASVLWMYGEREAATQALEAAVLLRRSELDGVLPASGREVLSILSNWLASEGRYRHAEELWLAELEAGPAAQTRRWLEQQLFGLYRQAVQSGGEVSFGKGDELFDGVVSRIRTALGRRTDESHASYLVGVLCDLWGFRGRTSRESALAATARFAFSDLPAVLERYQYRAGQDMVGRLADCLRELGDPRTALQFLAVRGENEPGWLARRNQDFWPQHAWRLGYGLREAGGLPADLEQRLLALVVDELRADLSSRQSRNRSVYDHRNSHFWGRQRGVFRETALVFVEAHRDLPYAVLYASEYLFDGLAAHEDAIDALLACYRRGLLHLAGRDRLTAYLQQRGRWRDSLPLAEELVQEAPHEVRFHVMAILAHAKTDARDAAVAALDRAESSLRAADQWTEYSIAALAEGCRRGRLTEESLALYDAAIALHVRGRADRGVGDGVLADYYRQKSDALASLGRTAEAVDAAAGAVVSWGRGMHQRQLALDHLADVLFDAPDLEAYVADFEETVRTTGLENPIVRRALGLAYLRRSEPAAAARQLELAIAVRPDDLELHAMLVRAYDAQERADLAAGAQLVRARRAGHEWSLYTDLGERLAALGQGERAERAFTTLAELSPEESEGHAALAEVRATQGRWADAALAWRHVVRVRTAEPTGYLGLARALLEQGELGEAREVAESVLTTRWPEHFGDVASQARGLLEEIRARG